MICVAPVELTVIAEITVLAVTVTIDATASRVALIFADILLVEVAHAVDIWTGYEAFEFGVLWELDLLAFLGLSTLDSFITTDFNNHLIIIFATRKLMAWTSAQ